MDLASIHVWKYAGDGLETITPSNNWRRIPKLKSADLNDDGVNESIVVKEGRLQIINKTDQFQEKVTWSTPTAWQVWQAEIADLNNDGVREVVLLVWRPFSPWPIDRIIPNGGRITENHDNENMSCYIILVGWKKGAYHEVWAGSALVQPILSFTIGDINDDEKQELVAMEGDYSKKGKEAGKAVSVWSWNGFGFSLLTRLYEKVRFLSLINTAQEETLVLTQQ